MTAQSFFYWGQVPLVTEIADDILTGLVQPKRSLFYARDYGAGLGDFENAPLALGMLVMIKFEAVKFMALRNTLVSDGNTGPDRRAVTSQSIVSVVKEDAGVNVNVEYILMTDLSRGKSLQIPIGGYK